MHISKVQTKRNIQQVSALIVLLLGYITLAWLHTRLAPLTTGPDELAHYEYLNFIASYGRLPANDDERHRASYKSDQPPLYHLLAAIPAAVVDIEGPPFLKRVSDHVRRPLIKRPHNLWGLYNTEDERLPFAGEILRWHTGRWVSIVFGMATILMTYIIASRLFGTIEKQRSYISHRQFLALCAAAIVAFTPRFILSGSMLNYEAAVAFFSALFLWALLALAAQAHNSPVTDSRPTSHILRFAFLLGLFAGLAITTKLSALILTVEAVLGLWLVGHFCGWSWQNTVRQIFFTALGVVAVVIWWFGFVLYHFNTVARDGAWIGLLRPLVAADASDATTNRILNFLTGGEAGATQAILNTGPPWTWLSTLFRTFWLVGIEGEWPFGWPGLTIALGLSLLAAYGLLRFLIFDRSNAAAVARQAGSPAGGAATNRAESLLRLLLLLLLLHLLMPIILPFIRYLMTFSLADTAQGRHILFPAAAAFATLLVFGIWYPLRTKPYQRYLVPLIPIFFLAWTLNQLYTMTWAYSAPLPVQTQPLDVDEFKFPHKQPLTDYVTLLGADTRLHPQEAMLQVDVLLQSTAVSPVDYLTALSLIDASGEVVSHWLGYAAGGQYPTRAWDSGDIVRDTSWLPVGHLSPGMYQLQLDLQPTAKFLPDQPLPELPEPVILGAITLPDATSSLLETGQQANFHLWQHGQPVSWPQPFGYRETVLVTIDPPQPEGTQTFQMVTTTEASAEELIFEPVVQLPHQVLFIVGETWPNADFALRVTGSDGQVYQGAPLIQVSDGRQRSFSEPPMAQRLDANFANQVKLLGYDLGTNRAVPGGNIPLTLHWQGLDWLGDNYIMFAKLMAADQTVYGGRDRLAREWDSTLYWAPAEIVSDALAVPVNPDAPNGIYYINVGLYKLVGEQPHSLPLIENGQPLDITSINIGPIKIGDPAEQFLQPDPNPDVRLNQPFGDGPKLTLLGYNLHQEQGSKNDEQKLDLTLFWRSEEALPIDYTAFVHLRNADGETVAQKDRPPLNGAYPTSLWDSGETIADDVVLPIPENLPAGTYSLVIGLYDLNSGRRLSVPGHPENSVTLSTLEISP